MTSRLAFTLALLGVAAMMLLMGCRQRPASDGPFAGPLPAYTGDGVPSADIEGVLVVDDKTSHCVGLDSGGEFFGVLWPEGYELAVEPYRVVDGEGRVVANDGDRLRGGGGFVPPQDFPNPCGTPTVVILAEPIEAAPGT